MVLDDKNIFSRIARGDKQAFEDVFREYYASLIIYARRFIDREEDVEEIVQQLFCNIWMKREKLFIDQSIKAYLFNSVRNNCFDFLKHRKVRDHYFNMVVNNRKEGDLGEDSEIVSNETVDIILQAIEDLPEKARDIFKMNRFEGLKYREIAEKLGISQKTVEKQMGRALKKLRDDLKGIYNI